MKKVFNFWMFCLMALVASALISCSSEEGEEIGGFKFENVHDGKVVAAANQTFSQIIMKSSKSYNAYVSATSDGSSGEEISWMRYSGSHLDDGKCYINIDLDKNYSGKSRSAYIVIVCDDKKVSILITQTTENDPNWEDEPSENQNVQFSIIKENSVIGNDHVEDDGTDYYELQYVDGNLTRFKHTERDEMAGGNDKYCDDITEVHLAYTSTGVQANWRNECIYYPSQTSEVRVADHVSKLKDGKVISGSIHKSWMSNDMPFEISYNSDGTLKQFRYNDIGDDGSDDWDVHSCTWDNGYLTSIKCGNMGWVSTYTYDKTVSLPSPFDTMLDLNMLLPIDEMEFFEGTNGNILQLFAIAGKLGVRSKGLVKEFHCNWTEEDGPYTFKMTYEKISSDEIIVVVDRYDGTSRTRSARWTIKRV